MAGTTAGCVSSRQFRVATAADDGAIRRLLRDTPIRGSVDITFERETDYFAGENIAGREDATILGFAEDMLACMGRCSWSECWVNGAPMRTGYLGELRLAEGLRGRGLLLREGYRFFSGLAAADPARCYFTAVVSDNERARRFLEADKPGMPRYRFVSEIVTLLITVSRQVRNAFPLRNATDGDYSLMADLLNSAGRRRQFSPVWTAERLKALCRHGCGPFFVSEDNTVCGALWDQRGFRQTVIRRLPGILGVMHPIINAAAALLSLPRVPRAGAPLPHAFVSPVGSAPEGEGLLVDFIASLFPSAHAAGCQFVTLALPANDPRLPEFRRRHALREWRSRIYSVEFAGIAPVLLDAGLAALPEVSLL